MKSEFFTTLIGLLFVSCGIFTPRDDFEQPDHMTHSDPYNFSEIIKGAGVSFDKLGYEDLFNNDFMYHDYNSGTCSKNVFINYLQKTQLNHENMTVTWGTPSIRREGDTLYLSEITYKVFLNGTSDIPDFSGSSNFALIRTVQWRFIRWDDIPSDKSRSFFSPIE